MDDTVIDEDAWLRFILYNHKYYDTFEKMQNIFSKCNIDPKNIDLSKEIWFEQQNEYAWWNNFKLIQHLHLLGTDVNKTINLYNNKKIKLLQHIGEFFIYYDLLISMLNISNY